MVSMGRVEAFRQVTHGRGGLGAEACLQRQPQEKGASSGGALRPLVQQRESRQLSSALMALDERSRDILERRWLADQKSTLQDLANEYGVSAERIRQLENNAIKKLRNAIAA